MISDQSSPTVRTELSLTLYPEDVTPEFADFASTLIPKLYEKYIIIKGEDKTKPKKIGNIPVAELCLSIKIYPSMMPAIAKFIEKARLQRSVNLSNLSLPVAPMKQPMYPPTYPPSNHQSTGVESNRKIDREIDLEADNENLNLYLLSHAAAMSLPLPPALVPNTNNISLLSNSAWLSKTVSHLSNSARVSNSAPLQPNNARVFNFAPLQPKVNCKDCTHGNYVIIPIIYKINGYKRGYDCGWVCFKCERPKIPTIQQLKCIECGAIICESCA